MIKNLSTRSMGLLSDIEIFLGSMREQIRKLYSPQNPREFMAVNDKKTFNLHLDFLHAYRGVVELMLENLWAQVWEKVISEDNSQTLYTRIIACMIQFRMDYHAVSKPSQDLDSRLDELLYIREKLSTPAYSKSSISNTTLGKLIKVVEKFKGEFNDSF